MSIAKKKPKEQPPSADSAFVGSDKHSLDDLKLQPWTPQREWAAALMGMHFPNLGREGRDQFKRTNVYPAALQDVAIFLFLSTQTPDEVDDAERNPDEARQKARELAIKRGIHRRDSKAFWDAYTKFWKVMDEIAASATKPKSDGEEEEEPDPNE